MSLFKTVDEAAHFMNAQKTGQYKRILFDDITKTHGKKFAEELRQKIKGAKK